MAEAEGVGSSVRGLLRYAGYVAFMLFIFAVLQGLRVCDALMHGAGLHGVYIETRRVPRENSVLLVWNTLVQSLVLAGAAGVLWGLSRWHGRIRPAAQEQSGGRLGQ